jgi:hypothetical protein
MNIVWKQFRALAWYVVLTFNINLSELREVVDRLHVSFLLGRADIIKNGAHTLAEHLVRVGCRGGRVAPLSDRLLPSSPAAALMSMWALAPMQGKVAIAPSRGKKWRDKHDGRRSSGPVRLACSLTVHEASLQGILLAERGLSDLSPTINVDLAQELGGHMLGCVVQWRHQGQQGYSDR